MLSAFLAPLMIGLLLTADTPTDEALERELEKLQGVWNVVSLQGAGNEPGPEKRRSLSFTISNGKMVSETKEGEVLSEATIKIDPTRKPATLDLTFTGERGKGRIFKGIYRLDGDTLTICLGADEYPTEFAAKRDTATLLVLKRNKP